jgi:ubiquinone/menaquinone biosynthesis C-methylase UbiE
MIKNKNAESGNMAEALNQKKILQVFSKVEMHRLIEQLIKRFSTNKEDIRKIALMQADLSACINVLELGCAFGSFTEDLKGRLHPKAQIIGLDIVSEYEPFFLSACKHAGYTGSFSASGINQIKSYPTASFDLVICSYALYFFPGMIPEIARILKKDGVFITITHYQRNMQELIALTKIFLQQNGLHTNNQPLPIEDIMHQFSGENGLSQLSPFFARVISIDFKNSLYFRSDDINFFTEYFHFKSPFFLMGTKAESATIIDKLLAELQKSASQNNFITMCKDDRIFVCFNPSSPKEIL